MTTSLEPPPLPDDQLVAPPASEKPTSEFGAKR